MEKSIKKASIINLISAALIMISGLIQLFLEGEYYLYRRMRAIIGYFIIWPSFFVTFIGTIVVLKYYVRNNFNKPLKNFFFTIPSLVLLCYFTYLIIRILIKF